MKSETSVSNPAGATTGAYRANQGAAQQLASLLAIPTLAHMSDADAALLSEFIYYIQAQAKQRGFSEGWDAATEYNSDMEWLQALPLHMTPH